MTLGSLYIEAQGYVPVLLENLCGMSCSGTCWPGVILGFSVGVEAFDEFVGEKVVSPSYSSAILGLPVVV